MVGDLHPQHPKERVFNYFNCGGPEIIEIIEIPAIFTWLQPNPTHQHGLFDLIHKAQ